MSAKSTARLAGEMPHLPETVWRLTAPPAPAMKPLDGHVETDVAIVGGGFTGLMAAITLRGQGRRVVVVDATEPGWGASGRNNGQVIPGFKWDPSELKVRFGDVRGARLAQWGGAAPELVFSTIAKHQIDCSPIRSGWIQPAYTDAAVKRIAARCADWSALGAPVEMLDPAELTALLGTPIFLSAWLDLRGGSINPLAYARGLARAALDLGVQVHVRTSARSMQRIKGSWTIDCGPNGSIKALQVLVATAAYADDLVPGIRRAMVPVRTAQVASEPLPRHMLETILPGRHCASDTRRLLTSFRISPDQRLVMGGSGATATLDHSTIVPRLHSAAREMFGHLEAIPWAFAWSGYFAVTQDHMPHIHESAEGVICGLGCNGRGIGISTAMGQLMAERLLGKPSEDMPLQPTPMRPFTFHAFRTLGVAVVTRYHGMRDRLDKGQSSPYANQEVFEHDSESRENRSPRGRGKAPGAEP